MHFSWLLKTSTICGHLSQRSQDDRSSTHSLSCLNSVSKSPWKLWIKTRGFLWSSIQKTSIQLIQFHWKKSGPAQEKVLHICSTGAHLFNGFSQIPRACAHPYEMSRCLSPPCEQKWKCHSEGWLRQTLWIHFRCLLLMRSFIFFLCFATGI
jgi:hypothetical protein